MIPCFHSCGTRHSCKHTLKIIVNSGMSCLHFWRMTSYVTPSAPGAFLEGRVLITCSTSSCVTGSVLGSQAGSSITTVGSHGGGGSVSSVRVVLLTYSASMSSMFIGHDTCVVGVPLLFMISMARCWLCVH